MEPLKVGQKRELEEQIINALMAITWAMKNGCPKTAQERILELEKYIHGLPVLFCEHQIYCRELRRPTSETGPGLVCILKSIECRRDTKDVASCEFLNPEPETVNCEPGTCKI